jgi:hypothetical protein
MNAVLINTAFIEKQLCHQMSIFGCNKYSFFVNKSEFNFDVINEPVFNLIK